MILLFLFGVAVLGLLIWAAVEANKNEKKEKEARKQEERRYAFEQKWKTKLETYKSAKAQALAELEAKYGKCTKEISVSYSSEFSLQHDIYAFEESEIIILDGNILGFKDIIGFNLLNKSNDVFSAHTTGPSRKNPGSAIVRGAAGKLIAEDDFDYETGYDIDAGSEYKVYVNVNSISSPTIVLDFGSSQEDAYQTANLLNVLINRNNHQ